MNYSRRQILRALALGGGVIVGELWWPGQKLISIPQGTELRYKATEHYGFGYTDIRASEMFGLAVAKPEGQSVLYDPVVAQRVEWSHLDDPARWTLNEASLEQMIIDIRRDMGNKHLSIKPRTITYA